MFLYGKPREALVSNETTITSNSLLSSGKHAIEYNTVLNAQQLW